MPTIPCSELRKQLLGKLLPESHGTTGFLSGAGSYFTGNLRGLWQAERMRMGTMTMAGGGAGALYYNYVFKNSDVYQAHQLYQELGTRLITDSEFRDHALEVFGVFASQNVERIGGRAATGLAVSAGIKFGLKGPGWMGPLLATNALKGDVVHLIEQGVDPLLALTAGVIGFSGENFEGVIDFGGKDALKLLEQKIWDDQFIQFVSGTPCVEGK